ncbi:MAG: ATP synthase F0 subunit C [Myxococcales bacterium]|nr:ATP synthase F0 subunit C [Myxococcales bacterium]
MKKWLVSIVTFVVCFLPMASAFAADGGKGGAAAGWIALAAGIGLGIAAFGGALGQGKAASSALEGIARNPEASGRLFLPLILGLALIESLVIYAFVIALQLVGKI